MLCGLLAATLAWPHHLATVHLLSMDHFCCTLPLFRELNMEPPEEHRVSESSSSHLTAKQTPPNTGPGIQKEAKVEQTIKPPEKPPAKTSQLAEAEKGDAVPAIPKIIVTEDRKTLKRNRNRVSSVLENTMDKYLEGYGDDYGALSSEVDLEQEGLEGFQPIDVARSLDRLDVERRNKDKKKGEGEDSGNNKGISKQTTNQSNGKPIQPKESPPKPSKKLFSFPKLPKTPRFIKKNKKGFGASNKGEEAVHMTAHIKELPEPGNFKLRTMPSSTSEITPVDDKAPSANQTKCKDSVAQRTPLVEDSQTLEEQIEVNSITVNTSVGSSDLELSLADGNDAESGDASLPMEMESIIDQVRRLQLSLEEYGQNFEEGGKVDYLNSSIFLSRNDTIHPNYSSNYSFATLLPGFHPLGGGFTPKH